MAQHSGDDPPHRFVDELVSLPLRWRHTHSFEAVDERGDQGHRRRRDAGPGLPPAADLPLPAPPAGRRPGRAPEHGATGGRLLTVAVTGSSGLVGSALCAYLSTGGHRVIRLVRRAPRGPLERAWEPGRPDPGRSRMSTRSSISPVRPSPAGSPRRTSELVRDSRVGPTADARPCHGRHARRTALLVCASAIGYYGTDRGDEELTEDSARGPGSWPSSSRTGRRRRTGRRGGRPRRARAHRHRPVRPGASLKLLRPLFSAGLGGPLAPGSQWVSWIGLDDLLDVFGRALADDELVGPLNAVAPRPCATVTTPRRWPASCGGRASSRSRRFGPRLLLGAEGASEMVQASQRVMPGPAGGVRARLPPPVARGVPAAPARPHRRRARGRGGRKPLVPVSGDGPTRCPVPGAS